MFLMVDPIRIPHLWKDMVKFRGSEASSNPYSVRRGFARKTSLRSSEALGSLVSGSCIGDKAIEVW